MIRSLTLVAAFAALAATGVHAQPREDVELSVSSAGVDFADARETRAFYGKLKAAAHIVCAGDVSHPKAVMAVEACESEAVSDAVRQVGAPQLSALDGQGDRAETWAETPRSARAN